jgi:hypothetical protein
MNDDDDEICQVLENLNKKFDSKKDIFQFNKKILVNYLLIKESLPFQIYFKNQFIRLIKADSIKRYLFLTKEKHDLDLTDSIIKTIENENKI